MPQCPYLSNYALECDKEHKIKEYARQVEQLAKKKRNALIFSGDDNTNCYLPDVTKCPRWIAGMQAKYETR